MKAQRRLSGFICKRFNSENDEIISGVFEDLTTEEQETVLGDMPDGWHKDLIKQLANTLNRIGEQLDLIAK